MEFSYLGKDQICISGGAWPTYYSKAKGVTVWSIDKKILSDFTNDRNWDVCSWLFRQRYS